MAVSLQIYQNNLEKVLEAALCLTNFPSQLVEKQAKPEVELYDYERDLAKRFKEKKNKGGPQVEEEDKISTRNYKVNNPVLVVRTENEYCQIESSINSCRISFVFKKPAALDQMIVKKITSFFQKRAETLFIIRKVPIEGFDMTFLITNDHLEKFNKKLLIDWILYFVESITKEINDIRLDLNTQARIAATYFVKMMANDK